jgi:hypothetical protein
MVVPFFDQYTKDRYGLRTFLCTVGSDSGMLEVTFDQSSSIPTYVQVSDHTRIRQLAGQYALLRYGIPKPLEHPPLVVLLPMPSAIYALGPAEFVKFLKEWPGESKVGALTVVEYVIMGAKHV